MNRIRARHCCSILSFLRGDVACVCTWWRVGNRNPLAIVAGLRLAINLRVNLLSEIMDETCGECQRTSNRNKQLLYTLQQIPIIAASRGLLVYYYKWSKKVSHHIFVIDSSNIDRFSHYFIITLSSKFATKCRSQV